MGHLPAGGGGGAAAGELVPRGRGLSQTPGWSLVLGLWLRFEDEGEEREGPVTLSAQLFLSCISVGGWGGSEFRMQELGGFGVTLAVMIAFQIVFYLVLSVSWLDEFLTRCQV